MIRRKQKIEMLDEYKDGEIITLLHLRLDEQKEPVLLAAYQELTPHLLEEMADWRWSTLAKCLNTSDPEPYLLISGWQHATSYQQWEADPEHRRALRPLVQHVEGLRPEVFRCVG